jgi:hypothetical protein
MKCTPENMQAAAIQLAGKASCDEVGKGLGVSGETIRLWTKRADWGKYWESAQAIVDARAIKSNIIHLHPDRVDTAALQPVAAPEGGDLEDHAVEVLRTALQSGCVKSAMWVLERKAPERWGTPKDRQAMLELAKVSLPATERTVTVTIETPARRKAAGSA